MQSLISITNWTLQKCTTPDKTCYHVVSQHFRKRNPMKNRRITPQQRPVISEPVDTVMPPFIHNLLRIMLPKGIFQSMEHYTAFVDKVIENEGLPVRYGVLHGDPKCNRVVFDVKSDPHFHKEQFCFYSRNPSTIKGLTNISHENALAEMIPETSTVFPMSTRAKTQHFNRRPTSAPLEKTGTQHRSD